MWFSRSAGKFFWFSLAFASWSAVLNDLTHMSYSWPECFTSPCRDSLSSRQSRRFLYRVASESQDQPKCLTSASVTLVKGYCEAVQGKETSVYGREKTVPHFGNSHRDSMLANRNSGRFLEALAFSAICIGVQKRKWTPPPKRRKKCLLGIMKSLYGNFRFSVIQY